MCFLCLFHAIFIYLCIFFLQTRIIVGLEAQIDYLIGFLSFSFSPFLIIAAGYFGCLHFLEFVILIKTVIRKEENFNK